MKATKTKYFLDEFSVVVNKRELMYDFGLDRIVYTYNGINKEEFNFSSAKKAEIFVKYALNWTIERPQT